MRAIAVMNNKGGVGKTVTAINLADILVREYQKRVVLADCDGQMNLTRFYLPEFDPEICPSVADVLQGTSEPVWSDNLMPIAPNLNLLSSSTALYRLDVDSIRSGNETLRRLRDFRDCAAEDGDTDYFIFDCPPGFTAASCAALMASDVVVIPMLVDGFSFFGMADMAAQVASMRKANADIRIAGVLITQWHRTDAVLQGERLLRSLDTPVFKTVIRRTDKVAESTFGRSPLREYSPGSSASQDYRTWVRELLDGEAE